MGALAGREDNPYPTQFGFRGGQKGVHTSRTMMLAELEAVLAALPADAQRATYQGAILEENLLGKDTASARFYASQKLSSLYALDPQVALFRLLRLFCDEDPEGRPLSALLCACARDPVLRCTAETILAIPIGAPVSKDKLAEALTHHSPGHLSPITLASTVRNVSSSWTQSGHLQGKTGKVRSQPAASVGATAFALTMGYLTGARGQFLFTTLWARLLDRPVPVLHELAQRASQRGWLRYRSIGEVTDITFEEILTAEEREALHEQT